MPKFGKKVSMQDIADSLGISKNAVSLALNNKPGVSEDLRKAVFKAAQELNYTDLGQIKEKSNYLLVIIHDLIKNDRIFYYGIFCALEKRAKELGYHAIITSITKEMEDELLLPVLYDELDFSGVILVGRISKEYAARVAQTKIPVVMMVQHYYGLNIDYVISANEAGSYNIVKYLIDNGHKNIGYIGPIRFYESFYERWKGYQRAMKESDLEIKEEYCILDCIQLEPDNPDTLEAMIDKIPSYPTAWFCGNDSMAIALINILRKKGMSVPEDISIAGFDAIEAAFLITPKLTTVNAQVDLMSNEAVELLIRRINDKDRQDRIMISVYGEIIYGDSVRKI